MSPTELPAARGTLDHGPIIRLHGHLRAMLTAGMLCVALPSAHAVTVGEDKADYLHVERTIQALDSGLFGEQVNLYTGETTFVQVDADIRGNNSLPVRMGRRLRIAGKGGLGMFGAWDMELPYLHGVYGTKTGWISQGLDKTRRCSYPTLTPPSVDANQQVDVFDAEEYWNGLTLTTAGGTDQIVLTRSAANTHVPTTGGPYPLVTKNGWAFSCLPTIANPNASIPGGAGEGFLARAPDGLKYTFNWLAYGAGDSVSKPVPGALTDDIPEDESDTDPRAPTLAVMQTTEALMLPTRIEDRFGNYVTYTYDAANPRRLLTIASSDGRTLKLAYGTNGHVATVSYGDGSINDDDTRAVSYGYSASTLTSMTLPDSATWAFDHGTLAAAKVLYQSGTGGCDGAILPSNSTTTWSGSMTHPSGAKGTFSFKTQRHGLSQVPRACGGGAANPYPIVPKTFDTVAIVTKAISGPGFTGSRTWTYSYGPANDSWAPCAGCATTKTVDLVDPDNIRTRYTFDNRLQPGGQLKETLYGANAAGTTFLRKEALTYASPTGMPWPATFGDTGTLRGDLGGPSQLEPVTSRTITQDGATFTWTASLFDSRARVLDATQGSSLTANRTNKTTYDDNTTLWVLGQVATNTIAGSVASQTIYNAKAMPSVFYAFGKLQQTLTYDTNDGTLASVKDGNNKTTTLSNWYRGIPQTIAHPTGHSQTAVVNTSGFITSITDENGYATNYEYDPLGRLTKIKHPTSDSTIWNDTTLLFEKVGLPEHDIAAGHWRRTVSTGSGREITYYDAFWQPLVVEEFDNAVPATTRRFKRFAYDHAGRVTFAAYPGTTSTLNTGIWTDYDALGRMTSVSQDSELGVLTTTTAYQTGFKTLVTPPKGASYATTTSYTAWDEPVYDYPTAIVHPEGAYTDITRDVYGKPTALTRRNSASSVASTRSYVYDTNQLLCKTIEPETASTVLAYDGANNIAWSAAGQAYPLTSTCNTANVAANQKVNRTYDARNRLLTLTFPDGRGNQTYTYTPDGLVASITTANPGNTVTDGNLYNKRRLLTSESMTLGPGTYTLTHAYNTNGHLSSQTYPSGSSGITVSYAPNALGQPTQAGAFASSAKYFPSGALKQFTYGNGLVRTVTLNSRQLPGTVVDTGAGITPVNLAYVYDENGNVDSITDGTPAGRQTRATGYDALDRLTSVTSPMFTAANYGYDVLDNLTTVQVTGGNQPRNHTYVYTSQRLTQVKQTVGGAVVSTLAYDVRGNVASKGTATFDFDQGNRLRGYAATASYTYDGYGRRVLDTVSGVGSRYSYYSREGKIVYNNDDRVGRKSSYIYLGGALVATSELVGGTTTIKYQHADVQGTPLVVTNAAKATLETSEYEPYGRLANRAMLDQVGYTGHVHDGTGGLTYMQQRYYDPQIGRFLSVDPVAANAVTGVNFNRYWYANNNPYRFSDPDGRQAAERFGDAFARNPAAFSGPEHTGPALVVTVAMAAPVIAMVASEAATAFLANPAAATALLGDVAAGDSLGGASLVTAGLIYRAASGTAQSMTPRAVDAMGLSAANSIENALPGKNQVIDTSLLTNLCAVCDNAATGHVSIAPKDMSQMQGWIDSRGASQTHPLTEELMNAVVDEVKKE